MTREARLTQMYLKGEILKLLKGESADLYGSDDCVWCDKYATEDMEWECDKCPIFLGNERKSCLEMPFKLIARRMSSGFPLAIPGALAIYMWLFEL